MPLLCNQPPELKIAHTTAIKQLHPVFIDFVALLEEVRPHVTRAEDGSRLGFISRFTRRVRWVLLLSRAAVELELRWCLRGDDDWPRVGGL
jgi:hypothetical protein